MKRPSSVDDSPRMVTGYQSYLKPNTITTGSGVGQARAGSSDSTRTCYPQAVRAAAPPRSVGRAGGSSYNRDRTTGRASRRSRPPGAGQVAEGVEVNSQPKPTDQEDAEEEDTPMDPVMHDILSPNGEDIDPDFLAFLRKVSNIPHWNGAPPSAVLTLSQEDIIMEEPRVVMEPRVVIVFADAPLHIPHPDPWRGHEHYLLPRRNELTRKLATCRAKWGAQLIISIAQEAELDAQQEPLTTQQVKQQKRARREHVKQQQLVRRLQAKEQVTACLEELCIQRLRLLRNGILPGHT